MSLVYRVTHTQSKFYGCAENSQRMARRRSGCDIILCCRFVTTCCVVLSFHAGMQYAPHAKWPNPHLKMSSSSSQPSRSSEQILSTASASKALATGTWAAEKLEAARATNGPWCSHVPAEFLHRKAPGAAVWAVNAVIVHRRQRSLT